MPDLQITVDGSERSVAAGTTAAQVLGEDRSVVAARVDSMARAYMAEKGPASISVAISRGSETLIERAWGLADVAASRRATAATVYKIGSVSKQFTAVLLLRQVERGRLALGQLLDVRHDDVEVDAELLEDRPPLG